MIWFMPMHGKAADSLLEGGKSKETATVISQFGVSYASELKMENENQWFCFTTNTYDAYYSFYTKAISIEPRSVQGWKQGIHIHVYSSIGEELVKFYGVYGAAEESIKLECNTTYYINAHVGTTLSCDSNSIGYYRLQIDCKKDSTPNESSKAEAISIDTEYTYSLDGTGDNDWFYF